MIVTLKRKAAFILAFTSLLQSVAARNSVATPPQQACPIIKVSPIRLPNLNIARAGHQLFYTNGEFIVAGGHTDGFVPTPTAEFFKDGEWHVIQMVYNHDFSFSVVLKSGKVLLGGGCAEPLGIGQTFPTEMYDPETHSFKGFGCLDQKRTAASALELDNGQVVIAGNWYHHDGIEVFDGKKNFHLIHETATSRSKPFIVQTAPNDALIFGSISNYGDTLRTAYAYQLNGDSVHIPLFDQWSPPVGWSDGCAMSFIGDRNKGHYSYLIPVQDSTGQVAIAKVENGTFSLLPTASQVPMRCLQKDIEYSSNIIVDKLAKIAYLWGMDRNCRQRPENPIPYFILAVDYGEAHHGKSAPLKLYYTDPIAEGIDHIPALTPEGNLLVTGGFLSGSNFTPSRSVWLLPLGKQIDLVNSGQSQWHKATWLTIVLLTIILSFLLFVYWKRLRRTTTAENNDIPTNNVKSNEQLLMERINELMKSERLYLSNDLKLADIAQAIGTNRRYISDCINAQQHCSFSQYVNAFRIRHAQQLLRQSPQKKLSDVSLESGFANEQTFFRTFKSVIGLTPREWLMKGQ